MYEIGDKDLVTMKKIDTSAFIRRPFTIKSHKGVIRQGILSYF